MKQIKDFIISQEDLLPTATSRQFKIIGEKAADFDIQVFNSSQQFYNFKSKTFSNGFDTSKNLRIKMSSNVFLGNINFPANGSGDTYTILIITSSDRNTKLSFGYGANSYSTSITQLTNTTLTFTPATANSASYQTFASTGAANITSTGVPSVPTTIVKDVSWIVKNTNSDAQGFGLRLIRQPIDSDWYFQTTKVISLNPDGDGQGSDNVIAADVSNLIVGMELIYNKGTTAPSETTYISEINLESNTISFTVDQAFEDGETMTFRAYGSQRISSAIDANIDFSTWKITTTGNPNGARNTEILQKRIRGDVNSTTVTLYGTRGISGGDFVTISGDGINNTSTNLVQTNRTDGSTATASEDAGEIIVDLTQTLADGSWIRFIGCALNIDIRNIITVNSHPPSNQQIYLDLDKFITPGIQTTP